MQALDPNYKTVYAKNMWVDEDYEGGMKCLEWVVCSGYYLHKFSLQIIFSLIHTTSSPQLYWRLSSLIVCSLPLPSMISIDPTQIHFLELAKLVVQYGHAWMHALVKEQKAQEISNTNPHEELLCYLNAPLEDVENVVAWWGVSHSYDIIMCIMY
jgi:hypothetical protein